MTVSGARLGPKLFFRNRIMHDRMFVSSSYQERFPCPDYFNALITSQCTEACLLKTQKARENVSRITLKQVLLDL